MTDNSGITFIKYAHSQKIEKANNWSSKSKGRMPISANVTYAWVRFTLVLKALSWS